MQNHIQYLCYEFIFGKLLFIFEASFCMKVISNVSNSLITVRTKTNEILLCLLLFSFCVIAINIGWMSMERFFRLKSYYIGYHCNRFFIFLRPSFLILSMFFRLIILVQLSFVFENVIYNSIKIIFITQIFYQPLVFLSEEIVYALVVTDHLIK